MGFALTATVDPRWWLTAAAPVVSRDKTRTPITVTVRGPFPLAVGAGYTVGSTGWGVNEIQTLVGATVDGDFGPNTAAHVLVWTTNHGPYATSVVNKQVWDFMTTQGK